MREIRFGWTVVLSSLILNAASGCGGEDKSVDADTSSASVAAGSGARPVAEAPTRMNVTTGECIVQTTGIFAVRPDGYSSDCVSCLCEQSPTTVAQCDDQSNKCWSLISCSAANCAGIEGLDAANCAVSMCGQFIEGAGLAMAVGALLQGDKCSAKCPSKASKPSDK